MPIYDIFHSETQPGFKSINTYTFNGLEFVCSKLKDYEAIFVFDRGYDDYKKLILLRIIANILLLE